MTANATSTQNNNSRSKGNHAREMTAFAFRHLRLMLTAFLIPIALGIAAVVLLPKSFETQSRLLLLLGREYTLAPDINTRNILSLDRGEIVNSELAILGSVPLKQKVLKKFGIDRVYPKTFPDFLPTKPLTPEKALELAVLRMTKDLRLQQVPEANIINVTFRHGDPELAAKLLNDLIEEYLAERRNIYAREESKFLSAERIGVQGQLAAAEKRLHAFEAEHGVSNYAEQVAVMLRQQSDLTNRLDQISADLKNSQARLSAARETLKFTKREIVIYTDATQLSAIDSAKNALLHLKVRREDLLSRFRDDSRTIGDIDREIKVVENFLRQEGPERQNTHRTGINPTYEILDRIVTQVGTEVDGLAAQRKSLQDSLTRIAAEIDRLSQLGNQYRTLVREREVLDQSYRTYSTKIEETRINEGVLRSLAANVRVIQRAEVPQQPRKLLLIVGVGSVLSGIMLALLIAFVRASTLDVFITPEGVERKLRLKVLLSLPYTPTS